MNNDLISRDVLKEYKFPTPLRDYHQGWNDAIDAIIDNAPTVEERPTGKWIIDGHHYKCSRCNKTLAIMFSETDDDDLIGCPFCLADMSKGGGRE